MTPQSKANTSGFQLDPLIDPEKLVLEIRYTALCAYRDGRQMVEFSGEGTEFEKEFVAPVSEVLAETRRVLKLINPNKYGRIVRQSTMIRLG